MQQQKQQVALAQFQNSFKPIETKQNYLQFLIQFMKDMRYIEYEELLTEFSIKEMQDKIVEYVDYLRSKKKVSPATIRVYVAALKYFFEINDFLDVNWKQTSKFTGEFYPIVDDWP
jgi:hypothetical protein